MIKVRVPGTSANLGPGFDTLGLALSIYSTFSFKKLESGVKMSGCPDKFCNKENLVYKAFEKTLEILDKKIDGVAIDIDSDIPISRGLGSSSACIVGGVVGAYLLTETPIDLETIFTISTEMEGHPDNVSPAIFGGLTSSITVGDKSYYMQYNIDDRFNFMALIPNFETSTLDARKALPKELPFGDVTYSTSRLGVILKAFENYDKSILKIAMDDKIHEPYRKKLIYEFDEVRNICREIDSVCFFISGSGSTLINVIDNTNNMEKIQKKLSKLKYNWEVRLLNVDKQGLKIYSD